MTPPPRSALAVGAGLRRVSARKQLAGVSLLALCAALDDGLARKPPMGWRSWNAYGGDVSDPLMRATADALASKRVSPWTGRNVSLIDLGFVRIGIDDGWQACGTGWQNSFHAADGTPLVNQSRFPDLADLVSYGNSRGLDVDWYQINCICLDAYDLRANQSWAALAYAADVDQLYDNGFAGVKLDNCGDDDGSGFKARVNHIKNHSAPILVENSNQGNGAGPPRGLPTDTDWCDFHFFRTGGDIGPDFGGVMDKLQRVIPFTNTTPAISRPGCWAYPDMLEVGNFGYARGAANDQPFVESRTHFGAWCVVSSPLMLGLDVTDADRLDAVWPILSNAEAIAVNQAWYGHPGRLVVDGGGYQVWAKLMANSSQAALAINLGDAPANITVDLATLDLADVATARDLWARAPLAANGTAWTIENLASHDSAFVLFSPATNVK
mmetsp:Transcript_11182/g.33380  ORF Transcript_11182/g.33380 Transcript_11182/m.33380 type:complete len:439 (+) Transcript_11182:269-1585(+)